MNIKIARTMLILCIVYIVAFYVLKFIFPEQLLLAITDKTVLDAGEFIESHRVVYYAAQGIFTFITLYFFACASCARFKMKWYELIYLVVGAAVTNLVLYFAPDLYTHTSISVMLLIALLCKGKLGYTVISFIIHGFLSQFLFSIRGFETIIMEINTASAMILTIEGWVWLTILGLIFYLKEKKNGRMVTTISQQND